MIAYKDFFPIRQGFFPTPKNIKAGFDSAVWAANEWIEHESIQVLNVETIKAHAVEVPIRLRVWYRTVSEKPVSLPEI